MVKEIINNNYRAKLDDLKRIYKSGLMSRNDYEKLYIDKQREIQKIKEELRDKKRYENFYTYKFKRQEELYDLDLITIEDLNKNWAKLYPR